MDTLSNGTPFWKRSMPKAQEGDTVTVVYQATLEDGSVITSYSIHYTKLYEC